MPANVHVELQTTVRQADVPKDFVSNSLYFQAGAVTPGQADYQALVDHVRDIFYTANTGGTAPWGEWVGRGGRVVAYDMAAAKPRPELAVSTHVPTTWEAAGLGPRHVALCMSFYAARNLPSQRGRIFLGPWLASRLTETPNSGTRSTVMDLAQRLYALGSLSPTPFLHVVHSQKLNNFQPVTHYWCNDVWDTIRKRLSKETVRTLYP